MKYFAAYLRMLDSLKSQDYRPQHLDYLIQNERAGRIFARGRFADGEGGLVIYIAESLDEAKKIAENDPYIQFGARSLDLHEWEMKI